MSGMEELDPANEWIWRAWQRLSHERQWQTRGASMPMGGSVIGPYPANIPWTAVDRWCEVHGYSEGESLFLDHCIQALDGVFSEWWAEQAKQKG
jgi:hypothetical protein